MNNIKVDKRLATLQDFEVGVGAVEQWRLGDAVDLTKLAVGPTVDTEEELAAIDVSEYTVAKILTDGEYVYDATALSGIKSETGVGYWIRLREIPTPSVRVEVSAEPEQEFTSGGTLTCALPTAEFAQASVVFSWDTPLRAFRRLELSSRTTLIPTADTEVFKDINTGTTLSVRKVDDTVVFTMVLGTDCSITIHKVFGTRIEGLA